MIEEFEQKLCKLHNSDVRVVRPLGGYQSDSFVGLFTVHAEKHPILFQLHMTEHAIVFAASDIERLNTPECDTPTVFLKRP